MFSLRRETEEKARREAEEKDRRENVWVKLSVDKESLQLKFPLKSNVEQVSKKKRASERREKGIERGMKERERGFSVWIAIDVFTVQRANKIKGGKSERQESLTYR